jgi:endoglucanase
MTGVRRPTMKGGRARISGSEFDIRKYFCGFIAALIFAGLLLPPPVGAQSPTLSPDAAVCAASVASGVSSSRLATLARGFNLTGWVDSWPPQRPSQEALARLYVRGFTHIRLPLNAELLIGDFNDTDPLALHLNELDRAIASLLDIGFAVSIDLHPGSKFGRLHQINPERGLELLDGLWRFLAQRYVRLSAERVFFEVLNEPTVDQHVWDFQGPHLANTIRREAPHHTIIYGQAGPQRIDALGQPLADPNVVYAVHFYDPMIFTHQGASWSNNPIRHLQGVPFPAQVSDLAVASLIDRLVGQGRAEAAAALKSELDAPWTENRIAQEFTRAGRWIARYRRPLIVNEFGVLSWKAPPTDRAGWLRAVRRSAERYCIGWTHWEYAEGFGFMHRAMDQEKPDEAILDALLDARG